MKTIELNGAAASEQALRDGQTEDVVVCRDGKPVAMVIPFDADDLAWYAVEHSPAFIKSIETARQQVRAGQTVSHEDLFKELDRGGGM
jgi:antitoxin (DNA-binding transcriptional repressor) of toxin-antitoxin stability system